MKLNFERLEIYTGIAHDECTVQDVRKDFADMIYKQGQGIECLSLAMKIFKSEGETDYTDEEVSLIKRFVSMGTPMFIDAVQTSINNQKQ